MFRIDDASAAAALPAPEAAGTEGYWTEGNPAAGVPATLERASWFNMIQEELRNVVVAGALAPSKTTYNQLLNAIMVVTVGRLVGVQVFSVAGTATYVPTAGATTYVAEVQGGGGSGGNAVATLSGQVSAGSGGAAGGFARKRGLISTINGATITVGAGGGAGATANGGSSSIGAVVSATGGGSGTAGPNGSPTNILVGVSNAGAGTGGDLNESGSSGEPSFYGSTPQSGRGGASFYGGSSTSVGGVPTTGSPGLNAASHGAGGTGAANGASVSANNLGGAGRNGVVTIWEYA